MVGSQQKTTVQGRTTNDHLTTVNDIKTPLTAVGRSSAYLLELLFSQVN